MIVGTNVSSRGRTGAADGIGKENTKGKGRVKGKADPRMHVASFGLSDPLASSPGTAPAPAALGTVPAPGAGLGRRPSNTTGDDDTDEDEDNKADERALMTILHRLKNAKKENEKKQKKRIHEQTTESALTQHAKDVRNELQKIKKRRTSSKQQAEQLLGQFFTDAAAHEKMLGDIKEFAECQGIQQTFAQVGELLSDFEALEGRLLSVEASMEQHLQPQVANIQALIQGKLEQLRVRLKGTTSQHVVDDNFSRLLQAVLLNI